MPCLHEGKQVSPLRFAPVEMTGFVGARRRSRSPAGMTKRKAKAPYDLRSALMPRTPAGVTGATYGRSGLQTGHSMHHKNWASAPEGLLLLEAWAPPVAHARYPTLCKKLQRMSHPVVADLTHGQEQQQTSPLRFAPVEMTELWVRKKQDHPWISRQRPASPCDSGAVLPNNIPVIPIFLDMN